MADSLSELVVDEETILEACGERELPRLALVEQVWETDPVPGDQVAAVAAREVEALDLDSVPDGGEVAVGAGSRGIANVADIVRGTVEGLQDWGYDPFVFPAMGSHGGATAEGQREKLATYGITESGVGCEIRATMDVEKVAETPDRNVPVYADANAVVADAIVPVNRVKPHTGFSGDVESGLAKMLVVGMGKQRGAKVAHEWAVDWSFRNMIPEVASTLVAVLPVAGGVAVVENQHHDTALIEGVPASDLLERETELLESAYELMPTLPFDEFDVAVVDRMGKNVSGAGMDTNVIGRIIPFYEPAPADPDIRRIFTRSLTRPSHGNASGVGMADFVHADILADLDATASLINALTSSSTTGVRIPPVVETDRAGVVAAVSTVGVVHSAPEDVRLVRVTDTQRLQRLYLSEALVDRARARDDLRVVSDLEPIRFDDGTLRSPSPDAADSHAS
jgi:hypothetical protein